jgi:hypothetical protein
MVSNKNVARTKHYIWPKISPIKSPTLSLSCKHQAERVPLIFTFLSLEFQRERERESSKGVKKKLRDNGENGFEEIWCVVMC